MPLMPLFAGFQRMTQVKRYTQAILGQFRSLEITYNAKRDDYHSHFHALLAVPPSYFNGTHDLYIKQPEWVALWRDAMRVDYDPSVDVRIIRANKNREGSDAISSAAAEVAKYAAKPNIYDLPPDALETVIDTLDGALKGRRSFVWTIVENCL